MQADETLDQYCEVWSASDSAHRRALLLPIWAPHATYTDPTVHVAGADALLTHIEGVQARRPGARIVRTSQVDVHHGLARFAWHLVQPDGSTLPEGIDIAFLTPDHRQIERIIGFFGPTMRKNP